MLLRFNAIVVAALAYVTVVRGVDPLMGSNAMMVTAGSLISHASLIASAASCGFAFPVINVEWSFAGGRLARVAGGPLTLDDAALERLGGAGGKAHLALCLGVAAGGAGRRGLRCSGGARHRSLTTPPTSRK